MFDVNLTLAIQFVNFVVTIVALDFLLIRPIRGIIKKRRELAQSMLSDAEQFTSGAEQKLHSYEAALAKAREEAATIKEECKLEATQRESELLQDAQKNAQDFLRDSRAETKEAIAATMADMEKRIPILADLAVSRLLGKADNSSAA